MTPAVMTTAVHPMGAARGPTMRPADEDNPDCDDDGCAEADPDGNEYNKAMSFPVERLIRPTLNGFFSSFSPTAYSLIPMFRYQQACRR